MKVQFAPLTIFESYGEWREVGRISWLLKRLLLSKRKDNADNDQDDADDMDIEPPA